MIVHLDDDTVPSPDALRYFDWEVRDLLIPDVKSSDGHQILLASGYNKPKSEPPTRAKPFLPNPPDLVAGGP